MRIAFRENFRLIKEYTMDKRKSSTDENVWKDITHPVDMFIEYLQSCLPVAFVDVTYD